MNIIDGGRYRMAVPDGWMAFFGADSGGKITPKKMHIYKGISHETDMFTHAGITVCFFDKGEHYLSTKHFYDNVSDMEPLTLGDYTWNRYICTSLGYPYTMLDTSKDGCVFQVMILMKNGEHEISLDDTDVRLILKSLEIVE